MKRSAESKARSQEWGTPPHIFAPLHREFGFERDACATKENALLPLFWTKEDDALAQDWCGRIWCNPPYRYTEQFVRKAVSSPFATVVMLVPVRPHTKWWHELVVNVAEIRWILGRFKFVGAPYNAPFPTCVLVYRALFSS